MPPAGRSRSSGSKSRPSTSRSTTGSARKTATASRATGTRRSASSDAARRGGAELTALESKLGEVLGLAMAAQGATKKVAGLTGDRTLKQTLQRMGQEAAETEQRCTELAGTLNGKKAAILKKARETKKEATEMMSTYLGRDADALDGFEFLTMAEAGEVGHWAIVETMNKKAKIRALQEIVRWVKPIQKRHFAETLQGSLTLAAEEDPNEPAS